MTLSTSAAGSDSATVSRAMPWSNGTPAAGRGGGSGAARAKPRERTAGRWKHIPPCIARPGRLRCAAWKGWCTPSRTTTGRVSRSRRTPCGSRPSPASTRTPSPSSRTPGPRPSRSARPPIPHPLRRRSRGAVASFATSPAPGCAPSRKVPKRSRFTRWRWKPMVCSPKGRRSRRHWRSIVAARRTSRDSGGSLRLAVAETRIRLKLGEFATARRLADSLLATVVPNSPATAGTLAALAALTGKVTRTAALLSQSEPSFEDSDGTAMSVPAPVSEAALNMWRTPRSARLQRASKRRDAVSGASWRVMWSRHEAARWTPRSSANRISWPSRS